MAELLAGVLVTAAVLVAILEPLFRQSKVHPPVPVSDSESADEEVELEESDSPRIQALLALKEIEFDRATGKLSDEDYADLKTKYSVAAVAAMKEEEEEEEGAVVASNEAAAEVSAAERAAETSGDPVELAVRRARAKLQKECSSCGPRPEGGAVFCSTCGRSLKDPDSGARCWLCGQLLPENAKFCSSCGGEVAA